MHLFFRIYYPGYRPDYPPDYPPEPDYPPGYPLSYLLSYLPDYLMLPNLTNQVIKMLNFSANEIRTFFLILSIIHPPSLYFTSNCHCFSLYYTMRRQSRATTMTDRC